MNKTCETPPEPKDYLSQPSYSEKDLEKPLVQLEFPRVYNNRIC